MSTPRTTLRTPLLSTWSVLLSIVMLCFATGIATAFSACDFDLDGVCQVADVEQLQSALGTVDATFDLDASGLVDDGDITMWLSFASSEDPAGRVFRRGDANLDGVVTQTDLTPLILNFGQPGTWSSGNFDGDAIVGGSDFTIFAYQFMQDSSDPPPMVASVPEPGLTAVFGILGLLALLRLRRGRN